MSRGISQIDGDTTRGGVMGKWRAEHRATDIAMGELAYDIARQVYARRNVGKVVVITAKPLFLLQKVRKVWMAMAQKAQRERFSALATARIEQCTQELAALRALRFVAGPSCMRSDAHVRFIPPESLPEVPQDVRLFYLCAPLPEGVTYDALASSADGECTFVEYGE